MTVIYSLNQKWVWSKMPQVHISCADRDDMFALFQLLRDETTAEDRDSVHQAMNEIIAQRTVTSTPMKLVEEEPLDEKAKRRAWASHVGRRVRELREAAGLTQSQLAEKAGIPQPRGERGILAHEQNGRTPRRRAGRAPRRTGPVRDLSRN